MKCTRVHHLPRVPRSPSLSRWCYSRNQWNAESHNSLHSSPSFAGSIHRKSRTIVHDHFSCVVLYDWLHSSHSMGGQIQCTSSYLPSSAKFYNVHCQWVLVIVHTMILDCEVFAVHFKCKHLHAYTHERSNEDCTQSFHITSTKYSEATLYLIR